MDNKMTEEIGDIWTGFHKELRAFIYKKTRNSTDADDILQDVFIKIIRNFDKVNQSENLRQYLYGITRNSVNDHFRSRNNVSLESEIPDQISETEAENLNSTIAECCVKPFINKLPDNYKEALLITEFQNVSQKELAEQLNISYSGAKSRVQRGKEKLKQLILDCCQYESDVYGNLMDNDKNNCGCS